MSKIAWAWVQIVAGQVAMIGMAVTAFACSVALARHPFASWIAIAFTVFVFIVWVDCTVETLFVFWDARKPS